MTANFELLETSTRPLRALAIATAVVASLLSGCAADRPMRTPDVSAAIKAEMAPAKPAPKAIPAAVSESLAEPVSPPTASAEPRIDLLINNAQVRDVFLAIVADTRYSMLMHPDVKGTLSVTLRGVTVKEALDAIRDVYGYDYKMEGRRITVYPPTLQTRVFTVNYPNSQRVGASDLRVSSGGSAGSGASNGTASNATSGASSQGQQQSSSVSTSSRTDFWTEMAAAVRTMVGNAEGRTVIASPHAGILMVRAMPDELRQVEKFLKAAQIAVERQVMLEAKIISVELRDGYQSGVNWAAMGTSVDGTTGIGVFGSGVSGGSYPSGTNVINDVVSAPSMAAGGGLFGLALAATQFQAVLGFLETQGDVQTLSSPRVATLNNQKAVLKVGTDELYVTNISGGTASTSSTTTSGNSTTMPTVTLTPFFSGISLDVTPQVDEGSTITLHIHPSVTTVTEKSKQIDLGTVGNYKLPLASSSVNETDTLVRIQDGAIVAIGGLMQMESTRSSSGVPGTTDKAFSWLFGNKAATGRKREVIVLIKPTIIRSQSDWEAQTDRARAAIQDMDAARVRVIEMGQPSPAQ
ncbi:secretin N-terminal domain-containing protein [Curvibacter sp. APW13]|uniref:secretin N-terminal domain-containing protein n=1 Tax=Curvibacter sp. APW13 TaxID=3077236 RepID=UPI0028DE42DB|nr:secretin N-terminal domain-containing protein [Curvibacter sp. APW13]MDT8990211.1 secretin N-terminal domain-containing protein [Curvibacter sp. APW13]